MARDPPGGQTPVRVYHIHGPKNGFVGGAEFLYKAMQRLPGVRAFKYECLGDSQLWGKRDLNIETDWAADALGFGNFPIPRPNFFWCSDTHWTKESFNYRYERAKQFDQVGVNIRSDLSRMLPANPKTFWLPYAAEPTCYKPFPELEERFDVGFIGHYAQTPERMDFLDAMFKAFPSCYVADGAFLENAAMLYCQMKVVLNTVVHNWSGHNMRVMEVLACGRCLLTPYTDDLADLGLVDGEHLATYHSLEEAKDKAAYYIAHPDERLRLGMQGRNVVLSRHTYIHRAIEILERFGVQIDMSPEVWHEVLTEVPLYDTDVMRPEWKKQLNLK